MDIGMEPGNEWVDSRYAHVMRRLNVSSALGALGIHVLIALSVHDKLRSVLWVLGSLAIMVPVNMWITTVLLEKRGVALAETIRLAANIVAALVVNSAIGWPVTVWLWLPFIAITFDGSKRLTNWTALIAMCLAVDTLALVDHVPWIAPLAFTALAGFCRVIAETRIGIARDMLERSERQREALNEAHTSLHIAMASLTRESRARERAELELRNSQKLEAVGRLASGVAHEINTPLQFVTNSAQFVGEAVDDLLQAFDRVRSDPTREGVEKAASDIDLDYLRTNAPEAVGLIIEGVNRVSAIVASLKEFAHPGSAEKTEVDLNHSIETALLVSKHEYRYIAEVKTELGTLPAVRCHPGEIQQVLICLVVNAAQAIAETTANGERGLIVVSSFVSANDVIVSVSDNGCGIGESLRDKVFEPLFTTKLGTKGAGQSLCRARSIVVDKHGGKLDFTPRAGGGTTFRMQLPLSAKGIEDKRAA
jgi:signal transduction histidine kinase